MLERRPFLVALLFAIVIFLMSSLSGQSSGFLDVLLGGVVLGYMVVDLKASIINGTILGLIMGVIAALFPIVYYFLMGFGALISASLSTFLLSAVLVIILEIIIGAGGGIIGSLIRNESLVEAEES
jgi:hypothetical protein